MVLSAAAKAARATVLAAIKRKKSQAPGRKKYPGLERKFRDHELQKARDQRHGQTHRQLTSGGQQGPDPYALNMSDIKARELGINRGRRLPTNKKSGLILHEFTQPFGSDKIAYGTVDQFGNKKIRGIKKGIDKVTVTGSLVTSKTTDLFSWFKTKGWGSS